MGEYAIHNGERVKIGTCEDMLYLRATQAREVQPTTGSLDPNRLDVQQVIRFRFPWPDEDGTAPGAYDDPFRAVGLYGLTVPASVEHHTVQFSARAGYLVSLPCPEGPAFPLSLRVHRNGFAGPVKISQQAWRGGVLALICQCGGCGTAYRLPTLADAEPVIIACRAQADKNSGPSGAWWHAVADRIAAGYEGVI